MTQQWLSRERAKEDDFEVVEGSPTVTGTSISDEHSSVWPAMPQNLNTVETAEVKQVWVINKIHGTDKYSLKSDHGKYFSCDKLAYCMLPRKLSLIRRALKQMLD